MIPINYCQWMVYRGCKNNCPYCEVPRTANNLKEDHLPAVLKTLALLDDKVKRLEFIGGEMLDYPYIDEIIEAGNKSNIEKLVLITTGINKNKLAEVMKLANPDKWGFCFTLDMLPIKAHEFLNDPDLAGSARKSIAGWEAFYQSEKFWRRGHVTIGRHNLENLPKIAKVVMDNKAYFNCCPIIYAKQGKTSARLPFIFRPQNIPNVALRKEDWELASSVMKELVALKKNYGPLFLPSEEYLDLIEQCCKDPEEKYPSGCEDKMPYLRIGDRVCPDGTFGLMICSDFYLPKYSVKDWVEKKEEVERAWAENSLRQPCTGHEGCAWSVSLTLSSSKK